MKLKFHGLLLIIILAILIGISPERFSAVTNTDILFQRIESVRKERQTLVEEQQRLQAELDKISRESQTLGTAVKSLDTTRKKLTADIKVTQSKIASTDLNIKVLENNVSQAERQIDTHQRAVSSALKTISSTEARSLFLNLLASTNFGDVWTDQGDLRELSIKLDDEVRNLRDTKLALSEEKEEKERVK
ncbi:MAG: hypothetical protein AAB758_01195, partial [Patescibacteria group bacterium]